MKKFRSIISLVALIPSIVFADTFDKNASYELCFTPQENCTAKIINAIYQAKYQILVQAYTITSIPITEALISAKNKGLKVKILLDKSNLKIPYYAIQLLKNNNIPFYIDYKPAIAHNKVIIIDKNLTIFGSFNFSKAAQEKNTENVILINDVGLAEKFTKNWEKREKYSMDERKYCYIKNAPSKSEH